MVQGAGADVRVPAHYTRTAIALHWIIAILIVASFALGLYMVELKLSPAKLKLYSYHKWLGVTIWLLVVLRLLWRATHPPPPLPPMPAWQRRAAIAAHWLLYALLLVIPLSGWLFSSASGFPVVYFEVLRLPDLVPKDKALAQLLQEVHELLNYSLLAVVIAHVVAAVKHHLVDRDPVLHRMLPIVPEPRHKP
jgi:cytochrome b561